MSSGEALLPRKLFAKKSDMPVSFTSSAARRAPCAAGHVPLRHSTEAEHHPTLVPRTHATAPIGAAAATSHHISALSSASSGGAKRLVAVVGGMPHADEDGRAAPLPQFHSPTTTSATTGAATGTTNTIATQTCASLASVGLLSEETQTEETSGGFGLQSSFNIDFNGGWASGAPSPKSRGTHLKGHHHPPSRMSNTPTPSAAAGDAEGALLNAMSDHHEQQRDRIMMADLVVREAKLQQAIQKMRVDHEKELAREQDTSGKMEALASKNSDLLRAERLQHEVAMNDMRLALETSKKMIDALQQQLSNTQEEAHQLKHVITMQEEASVRAAKDQSKKIVEAMEKHLVRQHDESEQRNATRVADEQRRYQERREEWLRTMRKEGAHSPQPPSTPLGGAHHALSSPNLGSTTSSLVGSGGGSSVPPGEAIGHSRSRNGSFVAHSAAFPLGLDAGGIDDRRSPRQALLQSSEADDHQRHRRTSQASTSGLSPLSSSSPSRHSVVQLPRQVGDAMSPHSAAAADRRKSSVGRVVTTAVSVRRATKRLSTVLTSPGRQRGADDQRWRSNRSPSKAQPSDDDVMPPVALQLLGEEGDAEVLSLSPPLPNSAAARRPTALPQSLSLPPPSGALSSRDEDEEDIAARCLQGGSDDPPPTEQVVDKTTLPPTLGRPVPTSLNAILLREPHERSGGVEPPPSTTFVSSADTVEGDASFLGLPRRGVRNMSLLSGDALRVMKTDMQSQPSGEGGGGVGKRQPPSRGKGLDSPQSSELNNYPSSTDGGGGASASVSSRQNWARRREQATKQLEASLGDVERLTTLLKERSASELMVDAEQRLQQCSDALKVFYETQHTAAIEALKKREREIADLFTAKAASLEAELNATSATVHSLHVNVETLERENSSLLHRVRRAESTKDSSDKLEVLQRALLSVGQDSLCCLCRENVLRDEVNRTHRSAHQHDVNVRGSLQVRPAHLLPHSPSVDKSARLSIAAAGGATPPHRVQQASTGARRPQTAGGARSVPTTLGGDLDVMPGSAMTVVTIPPAPISMMTTPMTSQLVPPPHPHSPAGGSVLMAALQSSQSPYAVGFYEAVQGQQRASGPPSSLRLGPASPKPPM